MNTREILGLGHSSSNFNNFNNFTNFNNFNNFTNEVSNPNPTYANCSHKSLNANHNVTSGKSQNFNCNRALSSPSGSRTKLTYAEMQRLEHLKRISSGQSSKGFQAPLASHLQHPLHREENTILAQIDRINTAKSSKPSVLKSKLSVAILVDTDVDLNANSDHLALSKFKKERKSETIKQINDMYLNQYKRRRSIKQQITGSASQPLSNTLANGTTRNSTHAELDTYMYKTFTKKNFKQFTSLEPSNSKLSLPDRGKNFMFILENSKLNKIDMVFKILNLELGNDDDIIYVKNKILTKIGNLKGVKIIKHLYFLDGEEVRSTHQLLGPCDIFILSTQTILNSLQLDNTYIPNFEYLLDIYGNVHFAFKMFVFLGTKFIENLRLQKNYEIESTKLAEIIYEDFEKIYTMFDEYYNDIKKFEDKHGIKLSHYYSSMITFIRENTMLICDLIDDLLNLVRKEKNIDDYDRIYINFHDLNLVMLSKSKKLNTDKNNKYSTLNKFYRLYEIMRLDKDEIVYRTRITLKLLQHLWEYNKEILDDKIDKLIKELLMDYEMCLNFYKEYIADKKPRADEVLNKSFEEEIKKFENHYQRYILRSKNNIEKDIQTFVNKVSKNLVSKIDIEKEFSEGNKFNQNYAVDFDAINSKLNINLNRNLSKSLLNENLGLGDSHKGSKKILNDYQLDQIVESHYRLTEAKLNKISDKLSMKKHKIHELTCLFKSMIKLTASRERNVPGSSYNIDRGIDMFTFKNSVPRFSLEDQDFISKVFSFYASNHYLTYEKFLSLMSSLENNDLEGKIDFFFKISDDDHNNYLNKEEIQQTCEKILSNIVKQGDNLEDNLFIDNLSLYFTKCVYSAVGKNYNNEGEDSWVFKEDLIEAAKKDSWNYKLITMLCSA